MGKKFLIISLAFLMLFMAACQKQPSVENPTEAPNITDPTVAADPSLPTQPTEPTTPPSEPTDTTEPQIPPSAYSNRYSIFRFEGEPPIWNQELDISGLREGCLYSYDKEADKTYLIADWDLGERLDITYGYIHLVSADRKEVIRCSYTGENKTVVYETENEITFLSYSEGERLLVTEENKRAILVEIPTGIKTVLVERDLVERAKYYPDSMNGKGPRITWFGEPPGDGRARLFTYYLETGEIVEQHIL